MNDDVLCSCGDGVGGRHLLFSGQTLPQQGTPHSRNEPIEQAKNETTSRFFNIKSFVAKKVDIFSKKVKGRQ
jgi:hypothetical protein